MAKQDLLTVEGLIDEILPDRRFGVMLDKPHRIIVLSQGAVVSKGGLLASLPT